MGAPRKADSVAICVSPVSFARIGKVVGSAVSRERVGKWILLPRAWLRELKVYGVVSLWR